MTAWIWRFLLNIGMNFPDRFLAILLAKFPKYYLVTLVFFEAYWWHIGWVLFLGAFHLDCLCWLHQLHSTWIRPAIFPYSVLLWHGTPRRPCQPKRMDKVYWTLINMRYDAFIAWIWYQKLHRVSGNRRHLFHIANAQSRHCLLIPMKVFYGYSTFFLQIIGFRWLQYIRCSFVSKFSWSFILNTAFRVHSLRKVETM